MMEECLFSGSAAPRTKWRMKWPEWNPIPRPGDHAGRERASHDVARKSGLTMAALNGVTNIPFSAARGNAFAAE